MQSSIQRMVSDGTLQFIDLAIEYIDKVNVKVSVDDVPIGAPGSGTPYTYEWITATRIKITPVVPLAGIVVLRRVTPTLKMYHVYDDGATFNDFTMDENFKQLLFIGQEAIDGGVATDFYSNISVHGYRITDNADGIAPTDLVTVRQYQADASSAANSAAAAAVSANAAQVAKIIWLGAWSGATAYRVNDAVELAGSSYIAVAPHSNDAPPSANWNILAQKGASGAGTGDVIGPASSAVNSLALFNSTDGKVLKAGVVVTGAGQALLDDADAAAQRVTLGLGNVDNTTDANKPVSTAQAAINTTKAPTASPVFTGSTTVPLDVIQWGHEKIQALGNTGVATLTPAISAGSVLTATTTGATTWTFNTAGLTAGYATSWTLMLTNGGALVQTWTGVKWPGGTAPVLTAAGLDVLVFTYDGTTIRGFLSGKDVK